MYISFMCMAYVGAAGYRCVLLTNLVTLTKSGEKQTILWSVVELESFCIDLLICLFYVPSAPSSEANKSDPDR